MAYENLLAELPRLRAGIGRMESGNNYTALGPEVKRKRGSDRAYGKYQVMGENIPSWTEQALGRPLTAFEFLHSPEAQERVFEQQMTNNLLKYRSAKDAASVWFSGRPYAEAQQAGARDINMPVSQYVNSVMGVRGDERGPQYAENIPAGWASDWQPSRKTQADVAPPVPWASEWKPSRLATPEEPAAGGVEFLEDSTIQPDMVAPSEGQIEGAAPPAAQPAGEAASWGFPQEAANAFAAGYLPEVMAPFTGRSPEEYRKARQAYEEREPGTSMAAEMLGGTAQGVALGLTGVGALGAIAPRVMAAAPRLRPVMQAAQRWATGNAGRTMPYPSGGTLRQPGMLAAAERIAAPVVMGGAGGATNALINQQLRPDVPLGEQIQQGAMFGAGARPLAHFAFGRPSATTAPHIEEPARRTALLAQNKYGIGVTPWQASPYEAEQQIARRLVSDEKGLEQVKKFGEEVGKTFNHKGAFTEKEVGKALDDIGNVMETVANGIRLPAFNRGTVPLANDLVNLTQEIQIDVVDPALQAKLQQMVRRLTDQLVLERVPGSVIQNITQKDGYIDKNLSPKENSLNKYYNARMKQIVYDFFYHADPTNARLWDSLRNAYKNAMLGLKISTPSGVPNVQGLAAAAKKVRAKGNMAELADISTLLPKLTDKGTGAVKRVGKAVEKGERVSNPVLSALGIGTVGGLASRFPEYAGEALRHIYAGTSPEVTSSVMGLGAGGSLLAGKLAYNAARDAMLKRPFIQKQILAGRGPAMQQQFAVNPLAAGVETVALSKQERNKRSQK